jgi:hypothetical protein
MSEPKRLNPKLEKWLRWIEDIHNDTTSLLNKTDLYDRYVTVVKANPAIQNPDDFHTWSMRNFFESALMAIRRLTDTHRDAISLMNFLKELKENPELITEEFRLRDFKRGSVDENGFPDTDAYTYALCKESFQEDFCGGGTVLLPSVVETDIAELSAQIQLVEAFIDNTLAHKNKGDKGRQSIKTEEVRKAIGCIEKIAVKYINLMGTGGYSDLTPMYQFDPEDIFLRPWVEK